MLEEKETNEPSGGTSGDGRRVRWEKHNEARRRRLLDSAIELLDESEVGTELRMAEIAERAGLRRTVIYRYFTDRQDLDSAIEVETASRLTREILPMLDAEKTIFEIIHDSIAVYVRWSEEHPTLRWIIDRGAQTPDGAIQQGFSDIAQIVGQIVLAVVDGFDAQATEAERSNVDPLVHGLIEGIVGIVRRWISLEEPPPADVLVHLATESVWFIMAGHADYLGFTLRRDMRLAELETFN